MELFNVKMIDPRLYVENFSQYSYPTSLTVDKIEENSSAPETFSFWELPSFISFFENAGFSARKHRAYFYTLLFMPLVLCAMLFILFCSIFLSSYTTQKSIWRLCLSARATTIFTLSPILSSLLVCSPRRI